MANAIGMIDATEVKVSGTLDVWQSGTEQRGPRFVLPVLIGGVIPVVLSCGGTVIGFGQFGWLAALALGVAGAVLGGRRSAGGGAKAPLYVAASITVVQMAPWTLLVAVGSGLAMRPELLGAPPDSPNIVFIREAMSMMRWMLALAAVVLFGATSVGASLGMRIGE
ncbi:MAG: hypothetical protein H6735_28015 [Alphaproteobacteria bacterium]|nr:hypothetical protein [Alphaproteobacteria bacterium]